MAAATRSGRWWGPALAFVLALAVRGAYLAELRGSELLRTPVVDGRGYDLWAQGLAGLRPFQDEVFYQAPLYPYVLSVVYRAVGRELTAVRLLQALAGATAAALLAGAGARLFRSRRAGALAGALYALHPLVVFYDGQVEKTSLALCALSAALRLAVAGEARRRAAAVGCGLCTGALGLLRENALAVAPVLLAWLVLTPPARPRRRRLGDGALFALGLALPFVPVAAHNAALGGGPLPTTFNAGVNLYFGNARGADGTYVPLELGAVSWGQERRSAVEAAERAVGRRLTPAEVSAWWTRRTLDDVAADPGAWARLMVKKWLLCWHDGEPIDAESPLAYADGSHVLAGLLPLLPFSVLFALAAWGAAATWPARGRTWLLHAAVLALTASVAIFFVFGRYRLVLVPPLALLAGAGLASLRGPWTWPRARAPLAAFGAALAVALVPPGAAVSPALARAITWNSVGVAAAQDGRLEDAEALLRRALAFEPDHVQALASLGEVLFRLRRPAESAAVDARALARLPAREVRARARVEYRLGVARLQLGRPREAVGPLQAACADAPEDPRPRRALALAYRGLGRGAEADAEDAAAARLEATAGAPR